MAAVTKCIIHIVAKFDGEERVIGVLQFTDLDNARVCFERLRSGRGAQFWLRTFGRKNGTMQYDPKMFAAETETIIAEEIVL